MRIWKGIIISAYRIVKGITYLESLVAFLLSMPCMSFFHHESHLNNSSIWLCVVFVMVTSLIRVWNRPILIWERQKFYCSIYAVFNTAYISIPFVIIELTYYSIQQVIHSFIDSKDVLSCLLVLFRTDFLISVNYEKIAEHDSLRNI